MTSSEPSWYFAIGIIFLSFTWLFLKLTRSTKLRLPPGPSGWPIVGNLPVLFMQPTTSNDKFYYTVQAREYGDIYKVQFGPQMMYVLCKIDYVREAFNHIHLQGRPPAVAFQMVFGPQAHGIVMSEGTNWKIIKQFTSSVYREIGVGKDVFEVNINCEIKRLCVEFNSLSGTKCLNLQELFFLALSNIICGITFGQKFSFDDGQFKKVVHIMKSYSTAMGPSAMVLTNRMICGLPFGPGKTLRECMKKFEVFIEDQIKTLKSRSSLDDVPMTFAGAFLNRMLLKEDELFNQVNLTLCCLDLFFAGTETAASTISFAILFLIAHPEVQRKCQKEIDVVVKETGMPSYSERSKLPYLEAVIHETQRVAIISPLGVPHVAERDLELFGYDLPKGTLVVSNYGSLFMNDVVFPDPHEFKPERYIDDGCFKAHPDIIPFSIGRRACLGEQLARMELFLFLANLLHQYSFTASNETGIPDYLTASYGGLRHPPLYDVIISKRNN